EALPGGIGGSSNALGKYLHGHTHSISVVGTVPWLKKPPGTHDEGRPNQIYIPRFTNLDSSQTTLPFIRGYGIEGAVKHYMTPRDITTRPGFGVKLKQSIRTDSTAARFFLTAFGTMLPRAENTVSLSDRTDTWGVPTVTIDCTYGDNDLEMARHMAKSVAEMAEAAGFEVTASSDRPGTPGQCVHEVGTARMGTDPARSVLDSSNRAWDVTNVIVVDGACFVSSGPQNPTLTMMAIALRASRELARDLRSSA
ncbi:MAG: GMC family oxidoreductase, partial [Lysobacter sp.]